MTIAQCRQKGLSPERPESPWWMKTGIRLSRNDTRLRTEPARMRWLTQQNRMWMLASSRLGLDRWWLNQEGRACPNRYRCQTVFKPKALKSSHEAGYRNTSIIMKRACPDSYRCRTKPNHQLRIHNLEGDLKLEHLRSEWDVIPNRARCRCGKGR